MADSEVKLRITGDASGAIAAQEKYRTGLKNMASETGGILGQIKSHWLGLSAAVAGAMVVMSQAKEYMEFGAKALQAEESFRIMAEVAGESADKIVEAMKRASRGTIDDSAIMQKAVKGMASGMSGSEMVQIMEAARVAARIAGEDVKTAYDNITDAISTGMPKGLKKYLLITKEEMSLVNQALKAGVEDIDLYTIAMANSQIQQAKFGNLSENAAESIQRHRARVEELKESIGIGLVHAIGAVMEKYDLWIEQNTRLPKAIANMASVMWAQYNGTAQAVLPKPDMKTSSYDISGMTFSKEDTEAAKQANIDATEATKKGITDRIKAAIEAKKSDKIAAKEIPGDIANWQAKIDNLGPALDPFAQKIKDIQNEADKLTLKWGKQAWILDGLAKGKGLIALDEQLKKVVHQLDEMEFYSGHIEGPFTKEDIEITRQYLEVMKNFDDAFATNTANAKSELDAYYATNNSFGVGLDQYIANMKTAGKYGAEAFTAANTTIKDSFTDLFADLRNGELKNFSEYMLSFVNKISAAWENMLSEMLANWIMTGNTMKNSSGPSEAGGLGGLLSKLFGGNTSTTSPGEYYTMTETPGNNWAAYYHAGGIVGAEGRSGYADGSLFTSAPRFHLGNGEYPAILQKGEGVFTKGQMSSLAPKSNFPTVQVNVINQTTKEVTSDQGEMKFDARKMVLDVILKEHNTNPAFREKMRTGRP